MEKMDLNGRDFLTLLDFTPQEIEFFINTAADLKRDIQRKKTLPNYKGCTAAMIFEKKSTRTRVSFQAACNHLGITSLYMRPDELQLSRGEPIKDTARVIDRYCHLLFIRTFGQEIVEEFANYMEHPVINALTDQFHPCQGLADLMTIREKKGSWSGLKVAYVGDIWNVFHSLMIGSAMFGMDIFAVKPDGYEAYPRALEGAQRLAEKSGSKIVFSTSLEEVLVDADVIYANTFHSMGGPEQSREQRIQDFLPYQINQQSIRLAKEDFIFMHCLPGYRGEEMTDEIIEGPNSVVFDQAENRMFAELGVLRVVLE